MKTHTLFLIFISIVSIQTFAQWNQTSLNDSTYTAIIENNGIIFAANSDITNYGKIFKSIDNGVEWVEVLDADSHITSIKKDNNNLYVSTYGNGIYHSNNNGLDWSHISSSPNQVLCLAVNGDKIYAGTDNSLVYSFDNGDSWQDANVFMYTVMSLAVSNDTVYAGTHDVGLYRSTDSGQNWTNIGLTNCDLTSIAIKDSSVYVAFGYGGVAKTDDGGLNWVTVLDVDNYGFLSIVDDNIFRADRSGGGVYFSNNNGDSWAQINDGLLNLNVRSIYSNETTVYIGTEEGVWIREINNISASINNPINATSSLFIYPNPANNVVNIKIENDKQSIVSIFDLTGKVLFEKVFQSDIQVNTTEFNKGLYLIQIKTGNELLTRKIIIN